MVVTEKEWEPGICDKCGKRTILDENAICAIGCEDEEPPEEESVQNYFEVPGRYGEK